MRPILELPQPLFVTTAEAAFQEAEELSLLGFDVTVEVDGNVYRIQTVSE